MKKIIIIAIAALSLCSCGKKVITGTNDDARFYLESWVEVQKQKHPEYKWDRTVWGAYILEDVDGTGLPVTSFGDSTYLRVNYTQSLLDGTIVATTYSKISQQLGIYDETDYYGPVIYYANGVYAGLEDVVKGMRDGGRRKVLIPGWLMTHNRYDTEKEYLEQKSDDIGTNSIYDIELVEHFDYIQKWSVDSVGRYLAANYSKIYGSNPYAAAADSAGHFGFYYIRTQAPSSEDELKDTTIYINYTGRLLNGRVFDTTIRDTAIFYGLDRTKSYSPVAVSVKEKWSEITLGVDASTVISGFALTISKMKAHEKGTGIFIPSLGYNYNGSGDAIPSYAPLRFDIELVDKP